MAKTTFDTNPVLLQTLLKTCEDGKLQLPDFQRSWVWEEERIMSLIASVSRGFPMGALMSLKSKIDTGVVFAYRPIEGAPVAAQTKAARELLARLKALLVLNWRQKSTARSQLKLTIEDTLDSGLPRAYTPELYNQKCSAVFEHVYESYPERNAGVYA